MIGPIHGIGFVLLLAMAGAGASRRYWGWQFPAIVLVTGGPIGSLAGEVAPPASQAVTARYARRSSSVPQPVRIRLEQRESVKPPSAIR